MRIANRERTTNKQEPSTQVPANIMSGHQEEGPTEGALGRQPTVQERHLEYRSWQG